MKKKTFFVLIGILVLGCTNRNNLRPELENVEGEEEVIKELTKLSTVTFNGESTQLFQSFIDEDGNLYATGRPFGLAKFNLGTRASSPTLGFAISDFLNRFSKDTPWIFDYYGKTALSKLGTTALLSGDRGLSVVDLSSSAIAKEVNRYPTSRESYYDYSYKAIVWVNSQLAYAFKEQNDYYYLNTSSLPNVSILKRGQLSKNWEGKVVSATLFNNQIVLACTTKLIVVEVGANGELLDPKELPKIKATWVTSTKDLLFVQDEMGIHVFDPMWQRVGTIPKIFAVFSVTKNNQYMIANEDDTEVKVYNIEWDQIE